MAISVLLLLSMGAFALQGRAPAAASPAREVASASSQDLETNTSYFDEFSVYSYGKVAANQTGAAAIFWNAYAAGKFVARTWKDGVLSPSTGQPPIVLVSSTSAGGGILSTNTSLNQFANLEVFSRANRVYLAFIFGGSLAQHVGFAWADITSVGSIGSYTDWHSANGRTPTSPGAGWDGNGFDILPENSNAATVVATRDGRIVIASQNAPGLFLNILYFDGTGWSRGTVFNTAFVGEPHLGIDDQDNVHLAFSIASTSNPSSTYAVAYITCPLGSQGADPTVASNWKRASGAPGFDTVIAQSGTALYSRSYLTMYGSEVRVAALSYDKTTFYFNVLRSGTWLSGTGLSQSGSVIPYASSQARYPYTFYQWGQDAVGNSYLFYEYAYTVYSMTWNGTAWSSPASLGGGSYVNVIGEAQGEVPGVPLRVFSRDSALNKLVLFPVPTQGKGPDTEGPIVAPGSLTMAPSSFFSPAIAQVNATIDDRATGGSTIEAAEFFLDIEGTAGSGTAMAAVTPSSFHSSNVTSVTWIGRVALLPGPHLVWVHGRDDGGNWGLFANVSFQVLQPSGPTSTLSRAWFGWSMDGTAAVGYQASAQEGLASVSLYSAYSQDNATFGAWTLFGVQTVSGSSYAGTFSFAAADGPGWYRFLTNATDLLGQHESLAGKVPSELGYDAVPPTGRAAAASPWSTSGTATLGLNATDDVSLRQASLFLSNSTDNASFGPWSLAATWSLTGTTWTTAWSSSLPDRFWRAALVVSDASGRTFNAARSASKSFGVDTRVPQSWLTSSLPAYPVGPWTVSYRANDNLNLARAELLVSRSTDNLTWTSWGDEANATIGGTWVNGSFTVYSGLTNGWVRLAVLAMDAAGSRSATTAANEGTVLVDRVAPVLTIKNLTLGAWYAPSHQVHLGSSENATLSYRFDSSPVWAVVGPDGNVSFSGLSEGAHTLEVEAQDRAGNVATTSTTIQVDGTPPTLAWCSVPYRLTNGSLVLCWTSADALSGVSAIVVSLDGHPSLLPPNATNWSATLGPGDHTVVLRAFDAAGNVATLTLEIPAASTGPPPNGPPFEMIVLMAPLVFAAAIFVVGGVWLWWTYRRERV